MTDNPFFDQCGYMTFLTATVETDITIEDLYQQFKARLMEELRIPDPDKYILITRIVS